MIFGRQIELKIESPDGRIKVFQSGYENENDFHIEFTVEMGKNFSIKIYNVLRETYLMCEKKNREYAKIELYAGYKEGVEPGLIASGQILDPIYSVSNTDRILEIKGTFKASDLYGRIQAQSFYGLEVKTIIAMLLQKAGIEKYKINSTTFKTLNQYTSTGNLKNDLNNLSKLIDCIHYFSKGTLFIEPQEYKKLKSQYMVLLDRESGLIGSPEKKGAHLLVRSLLNPDLDKGEIFKLKYRDNAKDEIIESDCKILLGKHLCDLNNQFYTDMECIKV